MPLPLIEDLLVNDQINTIDFYLCPVLVPRELTGAIRDVQIGWEKPLMVSHTAGWGYGNKQALVEYYHQDVGYSYDLENDAQRAFRRHIHREMTDGRNCYVQAYHEESLPAHRMPALRQIDAHLQIRRVGFRVNNRIYIHVDTELKENDKPGYTYMYVRYHHAGNVDTKKMQGDLGATLAKLRKMLYPH